MNEEVLHQAKDIIDGGGMQHRDYWWAVGVLDASNGYKPRKLLSCPNNSDKRQKMYDYGYSEFFEEKMKMIMQSERKRLSFQAVRNAQEQAARRIFWFYVPRGSRFEVVYDFRNDAFNAIEPFQIDVVLHELRD